ncbi:MAG: insulinase family protein [Chitinophagales bacterium]|nr:insulinase family protein [Chitinophagales bacterium]
MIHFERKILPNGLTVIAHQDVSTPLVAVNIAYDVGSRDEDAARTGFAHLFEHLMFSGSKNVADFDDPLQRAGGENNAYTTPDYTTFYEILPLENIETALWLESDRMLSLNISKKDFEVQRKVVVEEFKETCLNEPYGDMWHHLNAMVYPEHPYRWPVIGLTPEHIEQATLTEVRDFYKKWYTPANAVLCIAGNLSAQESFELAEKWFGDIPGGSKPRRNMPVLPAQTAPLYKEVEADVPVPALFLAFRMPARLEPDFYVIDLLSDILAQGHSSRLYRRLFKEQQLFSQIDAYVTASTDPGLFVVEGRPVEGVSIEQALEAIWKELELLKNTLIESRELSKILNRFENNVVFSEISALSKAQNLAYYEILDKAELINEEVATYLAVTPAELQRCAREYLRPENAATLVYKPKKMA